MGHNFDLSFRVKVTHDKADGLWYADCLDLQGCHTFGESREEAVENLAEVVVDRLAASLEYAGRKASRHAMHARSTADTIEVCA